MTKHKNGGFRKPPPTAGAVDLDAFRPDPKRQAAIASAAVDIMQRQGLVCPCGARIEDDGVEYLALVVQPGPGGQVNVGLGSTAFHSRECAFLVQLLEHQAGPGEPEPLAIRKLAAVEWLDQPNQPTESSI